LVQNAAGLVRIREENRVFFRQIHDRQLSQYAYIIGCQETGEAIVVDPMRDVERYVNIARDEGLRLVAVAETHIHADFVSGARELCERTGAAAYLSGEGEAEWRYQWGPCRMVGDGDTFQVGKVRFDVLHTPGHTPEHICFAVTDSGANRPIGVLTGDFVFAGDMGRPDLIESAMGRDGTMEPAARTLYRSLERFRSLSPDLQVWPGHGAGSACGKAPGAVPVSTVGYELAVNAAIRAAGAEESFVAYILGGQPEPPLYFARMKQMNKEGPPVLEKLPVPRRVRDGKLAELSGATGVAVCDTREWEAYRQAHVPGSLHLPLNSQFNTTAGCYVPGEMPVYLIIEEARLGEAVIDLVHVGLDNIVGYATPDMFEEHRRARGAVAACAEITPAQLADGAGADIFLLDVRGAAEVASTGRIPGATHIPHSRLLERIDDVPRRATVAVYCESGSRSQVAAGLLDRHDRVARHLAGGFEAWLDEGGEAARRGG
jgi:hydroxyacylglutathione hydrolase